MCRAKLILISIISFAMSSCHVGTKTEDPEKLKAEIRQTENSFMNELNTNGAAEAFSKYASEDAVIKRANDTLIKGKEAIKAFYTKPVYDNANAQWEPDFIDVSADGTLAYTFGKYKWNFTDSTGRVTTHTGVFHTVWKKMPDGSWKYVWD